MIDTEDMIKIYDRYATHNYDDLEEVIDRVFNIFITHKHTDNVYGFDRLVSINKTIHKNTNNYLLIEQKKKEFKMLNIIITDELAILCKTQYIIYNLCCNEEDFFNYVNTRVCKHITHMIEASTHSLTI